MIAYAMDEWPSYGRSIYDKFRRDMPISTFFSQFESSRDDITWFQFPRVDHGMGCGGFEASRSSAIQISKVDDAKSFCDEIFPRWREKGWQRCFFDDAPIRVVDYPDLIVNTDLAQSLTTHESCGRYIQHDNQNVEVSIEQHGWRMMHFYHFFKRPAYYSNRTIIERECSI